MGPRSHSRSDGEISSGEDGEKVTSSTTHHRRNHHIDSSTRLVSSSRTSRAYHARNSTNTLMNDSSFHFAGDDRDRSRSPYRRGRSGSRSPYRADKDTVGEKRRRQEDHYGKSASDTRRHKVYEDNRSQRGHGHGHGHSTYRDPDRPVPSGPRISYNDRRGRDRANARDSYGDRDRSRSPYRAPPPSTDLKPSSRQGLGSTPIAQRESTPQAPHNMADAKLKSSHLDKSASAPESHSKTSSEQAAEAPAEPESKLSEAELIEQRRKKREAIRKKHATSSTNDSLLRTTLESNLPSAVTTPQNDSAQASEQLSPPSSANSPRTPQDSVSAPASPAEFAEVKDEDLANPLQLNAAKFDQGQSAADYDPNQDVDEDRPEFKRQGLQDQPPETKPAASVSKTRDEFDMFAEDDDMDMFAAEEQKVEAATKRPRALDESLLDNWDYPDGHYRIINGELLDGRYAVEQQVGKGTFATVVRARDSKTGNLLAIKIACRNDTMLKAGQKEMHFLSLLNEKDPDDKRHIIRLQGNFMHKGHLCLVFEGLHMDLREVLKKFGRDVGINLEAVKMYAYQMFQGLLLLKTADVLHADLKPDNILINEKRTFIKICDFGTATLQQDAELTPYLVSRFYRAPEVILGMDFDYAIDMWAIGCTLYELYAGRILFNGSDNNNMLRVIQECRGKLPNRLIKRSKLADKYFDETFTFYGLERDKMTGNVAPRPMHFAQGLTGKDLKARLGGNVNKMKPDVLREHNAFVDLLEKCLQLDPEKRIKPKEALHHHFFNRAASLAKTKAAVHPAPIFRPVTLQNSG